MEILYLGQRPQASLSLIAIGTWKFPYDMFQKVHGKHFLQVVWKVLEMQQVFYLEPSK